MNVSSEYLAGNSSQVVTLSTNYIYEAVLVSNMIRLFDSLVSPVLNYNASVWGYHEAKHIEQVHCNFLRRMLKV